MSSTPILERATTEAEVEWVEVVAPARVETAPITGDFIIAIGRLRAEIENGRDDSITIDTDQLPEVSEDDIVVARYAADTWDE